MSDPRRSLPSVTALTEMLKGHDAAAPEWARKAAARKILEDERARIAAAPGGPPAQAWSQPPGSEASQRAASELVARAALHARRLATPHPRRVVNATGVVLHTNLGRAPLGEGAVSAALAAAGYADLEFDLETGRRGDRLGLVSEKLSLLTGAPAAMVCNNNAAAVLLALNTLAAGREVIVSRGELVEIGGSFRVPAIMERAGVRLVEVGTTNRTHLGDYEAAIGPDTALLLKVHRSNFEQRGFVSEVELAELAALGAHRGIPVAEDLGSGTLVDLRSIGLPEEAYVPARLATGADLVMVSGDKLIGGPQAGLVLGRPERVAAMRSNPMARALRLDKLSLAALDWTLGTLLGGRAERDIPVVRQLLAAPAALEARARSLAERLVGVAGLRADCQATRSAVGGGSLPGFELDSWSVRLRPTASATAGAGWAERTAAALRAAPVPVVVRVRDAAVWLDLRTIAVGDEGDCVSAVRALGAATTV